MIDATLTERAYGRLWRCMVSDPAVHAARRDLHEALDYNGRLRGIAWVLQDTGPVTDAELVAIDMRDGAALLHDGAKHLASLTPEQRAASLDGDIYL